MSKLAPPDPVAHAPDNVASTRISRDLVIRATVMIALLVICAGLLWDRLAAVESTALAGSISAMPISALVIALCLGGLSHVALAGYDVLAFTRIGKTVPTDRALKGGFVGTVFSQVLGFGLITGSFARYHIYKANAVSGPEAVALSGFVAAGFFSGLFILLTTLTAIDPAVVASILSIDADLVRFTALGALIAILVLCRLPGTGHHGIKLAGVQLKAPNGGWLASAAVLAAADLVPAALCLGVLLPSEGMPSMVGFIAIYVSAVALGHVVGSPGAIGPFESVMFLALPAVPVEHLAAAVIAYRGVYYLPPFLLAVAMLVVSRRRPVVARVLPNRLRDRVEWTLDSGSQAEGELALLGDKRIFYPDQGSAFVMYALWGRTMLVMGDPVGPRPDWEAAIRHFETFAKREGARIAIYKARHESKDFWTARGYRLQPLGEDAVIDPQTFTLEGSKHRELRRKLANARKQHVTFEVYPAGSAPLERLAPVAELWRASKNGVEQTFSMGHWNPGFLRRHIVVEARINDDPLAFVSLWTSGDGAEWTLDLMRQKPDAPNGTMHALIVEAITLAGIAGAQRFNLCMAPLSGLDRHAPVTAISRVLTTIFTRGHSWHDLQGLKRFKDAFRPEWEPRYVVARGRMDILLALLAANRLVTGHVVHDPQLVLAAPGSSVIEEDPDLTAEDIERGAKAA